MLDPTRAELVAQVPGPRLPALQRRQVQPSPRRRSVTERWPVTDTRSAVPGPYVRPPAASLRTVATTMTRWAGAGSS